jgi:hypothetical protein
VCGGADSPAGKNASDPAYCCATDAKCAFYTPNLWRCVPVEASQADVSAPAEVIEAESYFPLPSDRAIKERAILLAAKAAWGNPESLAGWNDSSWPCEFPDWWDYLLCDDDYGNITAL